MARLPRLYLPGCAQHVIQRGEIRGQVFPRAFNTKIRDFRTLLQEGLAGARFIRFSSR